VSSEVSTPTPPAPAPPSPIAAAEWGDPLSLGLVSFGLSALVLATVNAGWIDATATPAVLSLAFALGFFTEAIAGAIHYKRGETFAGLVFTAYAGFWLSYGLLVQFFLPRVVEANGPVTAIVGTFLLSWAIFTTYMLIASLKTTRTIAAIFVLLAVTFWLLAVATYVGSTVLAHFSGYVLLLDALLALFLSFASIVNTTFGRAVIPAP
jgi:succinate-acetate transporter protein